MTEERIFNYEAIRKKYSKEISQEKARIKKAEAEIERIKAEMEKIKNNPDAFSLADWRDLEQALAEAEQALNGASDAEVKAVMDSLNI